MKFSKTELFEAIKNQIAQDAQLSEGGVWRTNERGQHYYINKAGVIEAGMGGKFNGMRPEEMQKKSLEESRNQTLARRKEKREGGSGVDKNSDVYKKTYREVMDDSVYDYDLDSLNEMIKWREKRLGSYEISFQSAIQKGTPDAVEYYKEQLINEVATLDALKERAKKREKVFSERSVEPDVSSDDYIKEKRYSEENLNLMKNDDVLKEYVDECKQRLEREKEKALNAQRDIYYKSAKSEIDNLGARIDVCEEELARRASKQTASVNTSVAYSKRETPASASGMSESEYSAYIDKWKQGVKNSSLTDLAIGLQAQVRDIDYLLKTRNPNKGVLEREIEIADILAEQLTSREIKQKDIYKDIERLQQLKRQMNI